jgi:hypothetical protein
LKPAEIGRSGKAVAGRALAAASLASAQGWHCVRAAQLHDWQLTERASRVRPGRRTGRNEANKRAKELRPILTELTGLSANKAATELNRRGIATPQGGQWHALTVIRLRQRLAITH